MPETILESQSNKQFQEDYTRYGIYILYRRVLSDYRDGLKPVQRRILYAMLHDTKATTSKVKSAAVVGDAMKLYHPHGDVALYGSIKPLANWFEIYMPLVDGRGNWGDPYGNPAAAARYTECQLSKFAMDAVLGDLIECPESVDWSPSYSETTMEPDYLPVKVPLLLINSSFGLGLGLRADIPSHNINEVIDATIALMENPNIDITLIPDHCMSCEIYDTDFAKISRSGFGHYRIRGKIDIEDYKGKKALVIKSIPNLTYLGTVADKIDELIKSKKLIQIESTHDESTTTQMRYVIVLKNGSDPEYVKNVIYKNTNLEQNIRVNFETLNGFTPLRMSYKSYLLSFLDFRRMTKFRVYSNRLQKVQTDIHEKDAFIRILESGYVDEVIARIKAYKYTNDDEMVEWLIKKINITDLQAKYILNANIKKLSIGYLNKYREEAARLEQEKKWLIDRTMDDNLIEQDIRQELLDIKKKYGKPRNCVVISANEGSEIPAGEMVIALTERNFLKKVPANTSLGNIRNDSIKSIIRIDNTDNILAFDTTGRVFKIPVHKIPFTDRNSNGIDVRFLNKLLTANIGAVIPESVIKSLSEKGHHNNKHYLVTLTTSGLIKRMDLDDFLTVPPSGIIYAKIDKEDSIKDIVIAHSNFSIVVYANRKATIIAVNNIPYLKRNTKGSKAISGVEAVDGICVIHKNCTDIVVITEAGRINRISLANGLPNSGAKGKSGFNLIKLSPNDRIVSVVAGNINDLIHIKGASEDTVLEISNLKIGSSISTGDKILATRSNKIMRCYIEKRK